MGRIATLAFASFFIVMLPNGVSNAATLTVNLYSGGTHFTKAGYKGEAFPAFISDFYTLANAGDTIDAGAVTFRPMFLETAPGMISVYRSDGGFSYNFIDFVSPPQWLFTCASSDTACLSNAPAVTTYNLHIVPYEGRTEIQFSFIGDFEYHAPPYPTPIPPALALMLGGLAPLVIAARRRRHARGLGSRS